MQGALRASVAVVGQSAGPAAGPSLSGALSVYTEADFLFPSAA